MTEQSTHRCNSCGKPTGIKKSDTDGIKVLISRYSGLPTNTWSKIRTTRALLVHGGESNATQKATELEPLVRRFAEDGIAISLGFEPALSLPGFQVLKMGVILKAKYNKETDPTAKWGNTVSEELQNLKSFFIP